MQITVSDAGAPLYRFVGFVRNANFLQSRCSVAAQGEDARNETAIVAGLLYSIGVCRSGKSCRLLLRFYKR